MTHPSQGSFCLIDLFNFNLTACRWLSFFLQLKVPYPTDPYYFSELQADEFSYSQPDDDFRLIRNDRLVAPVFQTCHTSKLKSMDTWIPMNPQTCFFDSCDDCPRKTIQQSLLRFHILHTPLGPLAPLRRCFPSADEIRVKIGKKTYWA